MRVRVVSLLPSVTETLRAWGIDPVACTRFCEQPDLPQVGGTKDPDVAAIVALAPDVVVVDEEENRREDAEALADAGLEVLATAVRSVADVAPTLTRLAAALGIPDPGGAGGRSRNRSRSQESASATTAFVPIWRRPWMTINRETYGSSLLEAVGVANVFAAHPDRYPVVGDLGAVVADRVLAPSEPYPFAERHRAELEATVAPVTFVDGQDLFWWGVRTPAAIDRLAAVVAGR
ncbi:MAG TPA: helical backbone metal receptor [Acidimicrobiales bacterium]|nr:helical backbone metal receptor [Acidimicrobiales bacterium]